MGSRVVPCGQTDGALDRRADMTNLIVAFSNFSKANFATGPAHGTFIVCIAVGSRRLMPPDALQPKAYCTNPGL